MSCRRSLIKSINLLSFMSIRRSWTKPFHAWGWWRAHMMVLMNSWRDVQRSDLVVVTMSYSPYNTLEYIPSMCLGNILDLIQIHCMRTLNVIGQSNELLSPGVLLFVCESRLDSLDFLGSGYNHGGSTVKPPSVRMCFYFQGIKKVHATFQSVTGIRMKR